MYYFAEIWNWPIQFCAFTTFSTWFLSLVTSNVSQVDRLWTFLPTIYSAYFALAPLLSNKDQSFWLVPYNPTGKNELTPRATLMVSLITLWMFRLSYNTHRRGLFNLKDEDYRWAILRAQLHPVLFQIVNLSFIAIIQNVLLLSLSLPTKIASFEQSPAPLEPSDYFLAGLALLVLSLEFTADNQQYSYQTFKYDYLANEARAKGEKLTTAQIKAEPYDPAKQWPLARLNWTPEDARRGFVTKGLWAYSRHPNFLCEQSFWWIITLFPLLSTSPPDFPSLSTILSTLTTRLTSFPDAIATLAPIAPILPAVALNILFVSSTAYTEAITVKKYSKAYKAYQERVGMFTWSFAKVLLSKITGREEEVWELVWGDSSKGGKEE